MWCRDYGGGNNYSLCVGEGVGGLSGVIVCDSKEGDCGGGRGNDGAGGIVGASGMGTVLVTCDLVVCALYQLYVVVGVEVVVVEEVVVELEVVVGWK